MLGTPEQRVACLYIWCESWHQLPAGSLPADDRMLAHLSKTDVRWKRMRDHCLRGWVACSDGRLYHPVVSELAMEAWESKRDKSRKGKAGAAKRWAPEKAQARLFDGSGIAIEGKGREENGGYDPANLPAWIDPKVWHDFVEDRKERKQPMTERAMILTLRELDEFRKEGQDPNACLNQSIRNGWRGVFQVKGPRAGNGAARGADVVSRFAGEPKS